MALLWSLLRRSYMAIILLFHVLPLAATVSFELDFATSEYAAELNYSNDSYWAKPAIELTKGQWHESINGSVGRVWYARPVPLWDHATCVVASFNTTFSFQITPGCPLAAGDGMAFFLSYYPSVTPFDSAGGSLGLFTGAADGAVSNRSVSGDERVVAVEFDTHSNGDWESGNHVGIDVNSIVSVASRDTDVAGQNLSSGLPMTATVAYRNATALLSVDLQIGDTLYHVSTNVDLRDCLPEAVAVGFSAATGDFVELHQLLSWSFTSDLEAAADRKYAAPIPRAVNASVAAAAPAPAHAPQGQGHGDEAKGFKRHRVRLETLALAIVSGLLWLVVLGCILKAVYRRCKKKTKHAREKLGGHGPRRYQYWELVKATNKFDPKRMIGSGGSGQVYLGDDHLGRQVAVKKLTPSIGRTDAEAQRTRREFEAEVDIISRLSHKNLVRLFGWCDSSNGLHLVYEFISGGSLDKCLYNTARPLSWDDRYRIIIGLGKALVYLHGEHSGTNYVVHGDIKPSNIMLDDELNTKLGDFGLARLVDHGAAAQTTETVMGTHGYVDPEFVLTGKRCVESDVYSFGIVLLELATGHGPRSQPTMRSLVWELYVQNRVVEAASAALRSGSSEQQLVRVLVVGLWCTQKARSDRPSIAQAMRVLELQHADAELPVLCPCHEDLALLGESPDQQRRESSPILGDLSLVPSQLYSNTTPIATGGEQAFSSDNVAVVRTSSSVVHPSSTTNSTSHSTCLWERRRPHLFDS